MDCVGIIPARYHSQRLPQKALLPIADKPMVYWVYQKASQAGLDAVFVATDHPEILQAVESFGGRALLTRTDHSSGTERVAEAAEKIDARFFINIQGDEPLIAADVIRAVATTLRAGNSPVVSAMVAMQDRESYCNSAVVKVTVDRLRRALYFSRSPIPHYRDSSPGTYYKHLGIYGYTREFLKALKLLAPGKLESAEKLEQLRFLENGIPIQMVEVQYDSVGVDTAEDLEKVRKAFEVVSG
ncbi:MAG TPA: 3-deoxy-manno-octulosonate cytidylyltransferase [Acidobacteriota bacterium]|jgi:3-deoxy-manno-octulosonate cytidylyltransferase (CMP-KDO synthetase)|nr:3-deoxy-manno-octulosonate cytidylyltransferase [Acidobacteriota bacterium]